MKLIKIIFLFMLFIACSFATEFPKPTGFVNDYANVISAVDSIYMTKSLLQYEKNTSIEIAVVTVKDLHGDYIERYATDLFNTWNIGKSKVDDGILILLSLDTNDRGLRIEVGYGLEGIVTDATASKIIQDVMPSLKKGKYSFALVNVVNNVISTIGTDSKESRQEFLKLQKEKQKKETDELLWFIFEIILIIIILILIVLSIKFINKRLKIADANEKFKNSLFVTIANIQNSYNDAMAYSKNLNASNFPGAANVVVKLEKMNDKIFNKISQKLLKTKKHSKVILLSKELTDMSSEIENMYINLYKNKEIDDSVRNNLENAINAAELEINKKMPIVRDTIDRINKENPSSIWRGLEYSILERNVQQYIDNAKNCAREALKMVDANDFPSASELEQKVIQNINNMITSVQNIFDVENNIKNGKQQYTKYIKKIPNLISSAQEKVDRNWVKESTKQLLGSIKERYEQLQIEIRKNSASIDWILVGALVLTIVEGCNNVVSMSNSNISSHNDEEKMNRMRSQESYRNTSRSSYSSNGGGFGGFGGGMSGGGGATGRF